MTPGEAAFELWHEQFLEEPEWADLLPKDRQHWEGIAERAAGQWTRALQAMDVVVFDFDVLPMTRMKSYEQDIALSKEYAAQARRTRDIDIEQMNFQGYNDKQIAQKWGVTTTTINVARRRMGLPMRTGKDIAC